MERELLISLQKVEYDILCELDKFCKKHNIKYSLYAGTLLGAVRHKGYIPWDDDVDVAMTRKNYNEFCIAIKNDPIEGLYFESCEKDCYCGICHGKLRKMNTLCIQDGEIENLGHHGIWIDIFPLDKISANYYIAKKTMLYGVVRNIIARSNIIMKNDSISRKVFRNIFRFIPTKSRRNILRKTYRKLLVLDKSVSNDYQYCSMSTLSNIKRIRFPQTMVENYSSILFEDQEFEVFEDYKGLLQILYNNYMALPPESERVCKHNPVKVQL